MNARRLETLSPTARSACRALRPGCLDYREAWALQEELARQRLRGDIPDTLLLLEHPPTLTLGRGANREHLLAPEETLREEGFALVECDRGGDVTYHGPGQLVGYPILNLSAPPFRSDLHAYLRDLEEVLIRALAEFGIPAGRFPGYTGVWTGLDTPHPEKIAAIGIKCSRWVTSHGFALNVCPDMTHFDRIVPCGIRDYGVTSLSRLLARKVEIAEVLPIVEAAFAAVFPVDYLLP